MSHFCPLKNKKQTPVWVIFLNNALFHVLALHNFLYQESTISPSTHFSEAQYLLTIKLTTPKKKNAGMAGDQNMCISATKTTTISATNNLQ